MIKRLRLGKFGKFNDREFEFAKTTVFYGRNEAGKTTIFDALFDQVCQPKGNTTYARNLKDRYGEPKSRQAELEGEFECEPDEFLNLLAIRAGDLVTQLGPNDSWVERVTNSLYSGGINPDDLASELAREADDRGSLKHNRELKALRDQKQKKTEDLESRVGERKKHLETEKSLNQDQERLEVLDGEHEKKSAELKRLEQSLDEQEKLKKIKHCYQIIGELERYHQDQKKVSELSAYRQDRSGELEGLSTQIRQAETEKIRAQANQEELERNLSEARRQEERTRQEFDQVSVVINPVNDLYTKLTSGVPETRSGGRWTLIPGIGFPFLGGIIGLLTGPDPLGLALSLILGLMIGAGFLFGLKRSGSRLAEQEAFFQEMTDRYYEIVKDTPPAGFRPNKLQEEIYRFKTRYGQLLADQQAEARKREELATRLEQAQNARRAAQVNEENLVARQKALFDELGVRDLSEYGQRLNEYRRLNEALAQGKSRLEAEMESFRASDFDDLKTRLQTQIALNEREVGGLEALPEAELKRIKAQIEALKEDLKKLTNESQDSRSRLSHDRGHLTGSLGGLPEEILNLKREIEELEGQIKAGELVKKASGLAAKLFSQLAEDSSLQFKELSQEVGQLYGEFIAKGGEIEIESLTNLGIMIQDSGGALRSADQLSTGTRDSFWLAARLVLAQKSRPEGPGLLVFDEPFYSLDDERVKTAIGMLKKFQAATGWQIVLFTKDEDLRDRMKKAFNSESLIHQL